ncbi:hypothetical protein JOC85_003063 [Bacillus mesophilus]|uniref:Uncharacterized protein n=1 Tax=Bacillus mesophilus TaxID=1808955 RepID=A0A6M0QA22_9BACI|nr:hypothetical protein [Bacillus mesophilus]MBM7662256.1 hypothetical protein [Bacillus mesophilus]NEY73107.1 hypothetical protein [Bacillus mesophilus]
MKRHIGRKVYTVGKRKWTRQWRVIAAIADCRHYIVKYPDGRKTWIKDEEILFFWN